jgi:hypothetical protein
MRTEPFVELENENGVWRDSTATWDLSAPAFSQRMSDMWRQEFCRGMTQAPEWNNVYGREGVMLPVFNGTRYRLLYYYPAGLYINYEIDKAIYFPKSGQLLVFTLQSTTGSDFDTMHGFMLFGGIRSGKDWDRALRGGGLQEAREALTAFFSLLHDGRYDEAMNYYGGSYYALRHWNPPVPGHDYPTLLRHGCTINGLNCLLIKRIVSQLEISPGVFKFVVEFMDDEGRLFIQGPCCGATEEQSPPQSQFTYTVRGWGSRFLVQELPIYTP